MERLGIEIRTVRPLQRSECGVEFDGIEHREILERRKHLAFQHGPKVNSLLAPVLEAQGQRIRPDDFTVLHAMDSSLLGHVFPGGAAPPPSLAITDALRRRRSS